MNDLAEYLEQIVDPTFEEMSRHPGSERRMYLTCVAVYHAVDRMAPPGKSGNVAEEWRRASRDFHLVDIIAHHFKHVKADQEEPNPKHTGISIGHALGFDKSAGPRNAEPVLRYPGCHQVLARTVPRTDSGLEMQQEMPEEAPKWTDADTDALPQRDIRAGLTVPCMVLMPPPAFPALAALSFRVEDRSRAGAEKPDDVCKSRKKPFSRGGGRR